jgi:hypothetical protein
MFSYPKQAEFNRVLPKNKIYAHAKPGGTVKALFVSQIGEIVWKYKLSPETTNLPARHGISEIEVFEIALKGEELNDDVLRTIDKAIPFPILFQLTHSSQVRFVASYKRPSEAEPTKWVIEASFTTPWQPAADERPPLPVALDLAALYEHIIRRHIPLPQRPGEGIRDQVARFNAIQVKEKECQQMELRLKKGKQFNRKVETNAALRTLRQELEDLQKS